MYYDPRTFDVLPFYHNYTATGDWVKTSYFIPSYIGAVTEYGVDVNGIKRKLLDSRGWCIYKNYKAQLDADREAINNPKAFIDHCAEYCYTAEEAFALEGENKFNKVNIAELLTNIRALKLCPHIDRGFFRFTYPSGLKSLKNVSGVDWIPDEQGVVKILEHPLWDRSPGEDENGLPLPIIERMNGLYVIGVDGIDIGGSQTSDYTKDPSDFCLVVKKRAFGTQEPKIVALYKDRPDDIRKAYQTAISLALYYNARINIEATRMSFVTWAREHHFLNYFMKRPSATYGDLTKRKSTTYGTPATLAIIEHQTDLIRDYIEDYYYSIWFEEILDEANRYSYEEKRKFDIIAAWGQAELADEELQGIVPRLVTPPEEELLQDIGYYYDENGYKRFGVIPKKQLQYSINISINTDSNDRRTVISSNPSFLY